MSIYLLILKSIYQRILSNTQLTGFVARGPRASQPLTGFVARGPRASQPLTGFVARGPRASQPCAISKNF